VQVNYHIQAAGRFAPWKNAPFALLLRHCVGPKDDLDVLKDRKSVVLAGNRTTIPRSASL
jgi:hypothetical protein